MRFINIASFLFSNKYRILGSLLLIMLFIKLLRFENGRYDRNGFKESMEYMAILHQLGTYKAVQDQENKQ